jgi:hypothetical protein
MLSSKIDSIFEILTKPAPQMMPQMAFPMPPPGMVPMGPMAQMQAMPVPAQPPQLTALDGTSSGEPAAQRARH